MYLVSNPHCSAHICVVSGVLDKTSKCYLQLDSCLPELGVLDIDWVEVAASRVIVDVPSWGDIFFFYPGVVADSTDTLTVFFDYEVGAMGKLWSEGSFWGVVWD